MAVEALGGVLADESELSELWGVGGRRSLAAKHWPTAPGTPSDA
ncbi:hypothetical protein ABT269_27435 [Streptomyces viridosporus]